MEQTTEKKRKGKHLIWLREENLAAIKSWARRGLTVEQIAYNMNISKNTLVAWKYKYPEIEEALWMGRETADMIIENALYERAKGITVTETKTTMGTRGVETVTVEKKIPGDVNAQMFWLKNRQLNAWKERREEEIAEAIREQSIVLMPMTEFVDEPVEEQKEAEEADE